jgi:DNA-directed RNA polymerase subunit RPC12/RpoP
MVKPYRCTRCGLESFEEWPYMELRKGKSEIYGKLIDFGEGKSLIMGKAVALICRDCAGKIFIKKLMERRELRNKNIESS